MHNQNLSQLSSLVLLPIANKNKEVSIKNSNLQSLLEHKNQLNEIKKENSKGTIKTINNVINNSNNLTQHISLNSLTVNSRVDMILDATENSEKYLNVNPNPNANKQEIKYFLKHHWNFCNTLYNERQYINVILGQLLPLLFIDRLWP